MKLDCVLTACNLNPLYLEFVPIFVRVWKKLLPSVSVIIVLIADKIPEDILEYKDNIMLFPPMEGVSTAFISQYIRMLYPCILSYAGGVMITDMDMMPMNAKYYVDNIMDISDNKFIYYRHVLLEVREIAMCYNVATPETWSEIFNIKSLDDIRERIFTKHQQISYDNRHGGSGWSTDQLDLYASVMEWDAITHRFISLHDGNTGYSRLDRINFYLNRELISSGGYSDYHMLRPYSQYRTENELVYELLPEYK